MTTTNEHLPEGFTLPTVLKVEVGTIHIPYKVEAESLAALEEYNRELTHLLALIPVEDKASAELEDDGYHITTDNIPALKYACNKYFLCDYCTAIDVVLNTYGDEVCESCIDDLVDEVASSYTSQILSDGIYLVKEEAK
jgi:fructoselysine-6-P-deglycase FrlB-like protein